MQSHCVTFHDLHALHRDDCNRGERPFCVQLLKRYAAHSYAHTASRSTRCTGTTASAATATFNLSTSDAAIATCTASTTSPIAPGDSATLHCLLKPSSALRRWSVSDPFLYDASVTISVPGPRGLAVDAQSWSTGFRTGRCTPPFCLNVYIAHG